MPRFEGYEVLRQIAVENECGFASGIYLVRRSGKGRGEPFVLKMFSDKKKFDMEWKGICAVRDRLPYCSSLVRIFSTEPLKVRDLDEDGAEYWALEMEYVPYPSLKDHLDKHHGLTREQVREAFPRACSAGETLHAGGCFHADLSPKNVLFNPENGDIKVLDYGLAREAWVSGDTVTTTRAGAGTPGFRDPRMESGSIEVPDAKSDVYALGNLLCLMLCGRLAVHLGGGAAYRKVDRQATAGELREWGLGAGWIRLILKATELSGDRRHGSVRELKKDFFRTLDEEAGEKAASSLRRRMLPWFLTVLVAGAIGWAWTLFHGTRGGLSGSNPSGDSEEVARRIEAEVRKKVEEETRRRVEAEIRKRYEGEAERRRRDEEESRRKFEEETRRRVEAEVRARLEEEYRRREARGTQKVEAEPRGEPPGPAVGAGRIEVVLDRAKGITMALVRIPPGVFRMGSQRGDEDEKPVHEVEITKEYWLGETEVTQGQWEAVMEENRSHFKGSDRPVERVSWEDCQEFIKRLNERCKGQVGGKVFRLPTEAEWEYACRAGTETEWSWGDDERKAGEYAWYKGNSEGETHAVRRKRPNAWGLYDMHGNVWEWCEDWYGGYSEGRQADPAGPEKGSYRVLRGGSWCNDPWFLRSANRYWLLPTYRLVHVGLRVSLR